MLLVDLLYRTVNMAQSFARHHSRSVSSPAGDESFDDEILNSPSIGDEFSPLSDNEMSHSIYIFPHPPSAGGSSTPSSPYACSSVLSIPTDFSFPSSDSINFESRQGPDHERNILRSPNRSRRNRSATQSTGALSWAAVSRRSASVDTQSFVHENFYWEEARLGVRDTEFQILDPDTSQRHQYYPRYQQHPLGRQPQRNFFCYADGRFQYKARIDREQLFVAEEEVCQTDIYSTKASAVALRLPLVSFLSRIFSLDPSTLKLLSHTSAQESLIFPGLSFNIDLTDDKDVINDRRRAFRLAILETHSVKEGIDIACDKSASPPIFSYLPFLDVVVGICSSSRLWWTSKLQYYTQK